MLLTVVPIALSNCLPSKVVFRQRSSSVKGRLPSKVIFHKRSSSIKGRIPSKVIFRQRSSSVKGPLPSKVVFRQRSYSFKGRLPSKVVFHQRLSSVKGRLPSNVFFRQRSSSSKLTVTLICLVRESSNYKLGRLEKTATSQPRYLVQDGGRTMKIFQYYYIAKYIQRTTEQLIMSPWDLESISDQAGYWAAYTAKKFSIFSRKQVNQVNHQKHTYYINGKSLEWWRILESKHCLKNMASRSEVNPPKRHTHLKKNSRFSRESKSTKSTTKRTHTISVENL